jgi:o-succinylbenzoate---CoA ligase
MERVELIRLLGARPAGAVAVQTSIVSEREPARFIERFTQAVAAGGTVFLADPQWGERELAQFEALVNRPRVAGDEEERSEQGWLCIPTGGSSGNLRLARHDTGTLAAAVRGFGAHFGVKQINVVGVLPLYHVSGLLAWLRTVFTGGTYLPWSWKALEAGAYPHLAHGAGDWFISLVPTQLQRLVGNAQTEAWLRGFRAVFVGGGPAWPELIEAAARARLPLSFAYGMTETAAMVTALRPEEFLAGERGCGRALPHTQIELSADGRISLRGTSLFRGYWPEMRTEDSWITEDLGRFNSQGGLDVLGRNDALIITGGEKVDPAEVEAALRATGQFADVAVIGVPDARWGEVVVAFYAATHGAEVELPVLPQLAAFKWPKRVIAVPEWPRNAQGKVNRAALRAWFETTQDA